MSVCLGINSGCKFIMCVMLPLPSGWAGPGYIDEEGRGGLVLRKGQDPVVYQGTGSINVGVRKGHLCEEVISEPEKKILETSGEIEDEEGEGENIPGPQGNFQPEARTVPSSRCKKAPRGRRAGLADPLRPS